MGTLLIDLNTALQRVTHFHQEIWKLDDNLAAGIPEDILDKELEGAETFSHRVVTAAAKQRCHIRDAECPRSS